MDKRRKFQYGDRVVCKANGRTGTIVNYFEGKYNVIFDDKKIEIGYKSNELDKLEEMPISSITFDDLVLPLNDALERNKHLHVTVKDNEVHAVLKCGNEIVKRTSAKCHPDDKFDFEIGAKLAIERIFKETETPKTEELKVGDYVVCAGCLGVIKGFKTNGNVKVYAIELFGDQCHHSHTCDGKCLNGIYGYDYEITKIKEPKFKYGNKVEVLSNSFPNGKGTIIGYSDKNDCYLVEYEENKEFFMHNGTITGVKWGHTGTNSNCLWVKEFDLELYKPKRYFDKFKFIESEGIDDYKMHADWVDICHGQEVIDGLVITEKQGTYHSNIAWEIEK